MEPAQNKELIRSIGRAENLDAMLALMADDVRYTVIGRTKYSGTFTGKKELVDKLILPLVSQLASMGSSTTTR